MRSSGFTFSRLYFSVLPVMLLDSVVIQAVRSTRSKYREAKCISCTSRAVEPSNIKFAHLCNPVILMTSLRPNDFCRGISRKTRGFQESQSRRLWKCPSSGKRTLTSTSQSSTADRCLMSTRVSPEPSPHAAKHALELCTVSS